MKVGTESHTGRTMWKRSRQEWTCSPTSNSGQTNPKKRAPHSCGKSFLLRKRKMLLNWVLKKVNFDGKRSGEGGINASLFSRKNEGTWSHKISNARLIRKIPSSLAWLEHRTSMKNGRNHWKGRSGPWHGHGAAARHSMGYMPKTKLLPLRSLQL